MYAGGLMIRTAIIGYGFSAQTFHVPFIHTDSRFQLTHIVTSKPDRVELDFPNIAAVPSYTSLDPDQIDLVVITTPNHLHFEIADYFLNVHCHVVVEKPFVLQLSQAQALAELAKKVDRHIVVFQNRRWDGDFLTIQSLLDSDRIGQLKRLTSRFDRFRPEVQDRWREQPGDGSGILWDLGPHLLDQVVTLLGQPESIQARLGCLRDGASVVDNFDLWLDYGDCEVTLGSSSFQAGPNQRFLLEGTKGSFVKYGLDVQEDALRAATDVLHERWGEEPEESWGILYQEHNSQLITTKPGNYAMFWHQLALSILKGNEVPVPLNEAVLVIRLIEMAIESHEQGCKLML
jgi:predicted dehydrogenase